MAVGDAHVFSDFPTSVLTQISFQSHRLLFSQASAEVRGENTPESSPQLEIETQTSSHEFDTLTTELNRPVKARTCLGKGSIDWIYTQA